MKSEKLSDMLLSEAHAKLDKDFCSAASEIGICIKWNLPIPTDIKKKFYRALESLRFFLDANGARMPLPRFRYNPYAQREPKNEIQNY